MGAIHQVRTALWQLVDGYGGAKPPQGTVESWTHRLATGMLALRLGTTPALGAA